MPDKEDDLDRQHRLDVEAMMKERDAREAARKPQIRRSNADVVSVMPAASSEVERAQTVAQREAEHMAKYTPPAWATRPEPTSATGNDILHPTQEEDDGVREKIRSLGFRQGEEAGKAVGEKLSQSVSQGFKDRINGLIGRYAGTVNPAKHQAGLNRQLEENKELIRLRQQQIREQSAPRDLGDIDEPGVRQPVQQEREFTDPESKARYIELIRKAQENAKK